MFKTWHAGAHLMRPSWSWLSTSPS